MTIAFRSSANNTPGVAVTSITVNVPAGVVNGDVLVFVVATDSSGQNITTPGGWNALVNQRYNANNNGFGVFWRVANSEPASYTVTLSASGQARGFMSAYTGVDTTTPIDVAGTVNTATGTNITVLGVTTVTANSMAIAAQANTANPTSIGAPALWTNRDSFVGNFGMSDNERLFAAIGATGNANITLGTSRAWISYMLALREAAASATNVRNRALIQGM